MNTNLESGLNGRLAGLNCPSGSLLIFSLCFLTPGWPTLIQPEVHGCMRGLLEQDSQGLWLYLVEVIVF